ncbi:MAG TPA: acylphosphatase [Burkholderiales bacterium]|nr:acylphosphatase [Burkholderiales bacterium]
MLTKRLIVTGRVQGVGFREAMCREARRLGATGWVRNRADGTVEAIVQGTEQVVAQLVLWAQRGPPASRVTQVDVENATGDFATFDWRATVD